MVSPSPFPSAVICPTSSLESLSSVSHQTLGKDVYQRNRALRALASATPPPPPSPVSSPTSSVDSIILVSHQRRGEKLYADNRAVVGATHYAPSESDCITLVNAPATSVTKPILPIIPTRSPGQKWYCVTVGRKVGAIQGW